MDNPLPSQLNVNANNPQPSVPPGVFPKKGFRLNKLILLIGISATIFIVGSVGYFLGANATRTPAIQHSACTLEAKICPDGSSVGRSGPNCEFSPCPIITSSALGLSPTVTSELSNQLHWKNYVCKYDGYSLSVPDELGVSMFDGFMGGDGECPIEIDHRISVYTAPDDLLKLPYYEIKEIKNVHINGLEGKYAKINYTDSDKTIKHLVVYQFKNNDYVYLTLNLDYKDEYKQLDFNKDTNWDEMIDEYHKVQNKDQQQINIFNVLDQIASSLKFIPAVPRPTSDFRLPVAAKPVIYLYPERKTEVRVKVKFDPGFAVTYPSYRQGWDVTAEPQGKLIDNFDGKEYNYLFWEGNPDPNANYDLSTGFVIKGEDTVSFLQGKLSEMGLTPKEYNEFIVYWYPKMKENRYNLIHFASNSEYNDRVQMDIFPKPDSLLRVFMVYKPLIKFENIPPQIITPFQRYGFSVIEWGGSLLY